MWIRYNCEADAYHDKYADIGHQASGLNPAVVIGKQYVVQVPEKMRI